MTRSMIRIICMARMGCSMVDLMRRMSSGVLTCLVAVWVALAVLGCGGAASGSDARDELSVEEAKAILQELPYRYEFREPAIPQGATGAIAGRVHGPHKTWFDFGVALGNNAAPVPVPRSGVSEVIGNPGFVFTMNDLIPRGRLHWETAPQLKAPVRNRESSRMATEMVEELCLATTGEPCPV